MSTEKTNQKTSRKQSFAKASVRKLAAILFADIVGYTALMQTDEATARKNLDKFRTTLNNKVALHNGQVVNYYGDGCLCTFDSAVDAMTCAKEVQQIFQSEPKVPVRLGLHSGDVFFEADNVFGNSVNIASRIESLGLPGTLLFSERIKRDIENQTDFTIQSLGEFDFKNVKRPVEVFALANEGFIIPQREEMKGKLKAAEPKSNKWLMVASVLVLTLIGIVTWNLYDQKTSRLLDESELSATLSKEVRDKRVAVMVFENLTMDPSLDAFGKMTSDWITKGLMETNKVNVISGANIQSKIQLAGIGQGAAKKLAQETGIGVILEGRYYLQEGELIIHTNIVDAKRGEVIHAMDLIQGPKDKMLNLLDQLTQDIGILGNRQAS